MEAWRFLYFEKEAPTINIISQSKGAQVWNPFSELAAKPLRHRGSGILY